MRKTEQNPKSWLSENIAQLRDGRGPSRKLSNWREQTSAAGPPGFENPFQFSRNMLRITKPTLAGRSPSRRMKYGNHWRPNGMYNRTP